jgi:hypothetical protein
MKIKVKSINDVIEFKVLDLIKFKFKFSPYLPCFSQNYGFKFGSISEYWMEIGKKDTLISLVSMQKEKRISGLTFNEMLQRSALIEFGPMGCGAVLWNINQISFGRVLDRFPDTSSKIFNEDFVFIRADSREQARKILNKITPIMADVILVDKGLIFDSNVEDIYS